MKYENLMLSGLFVVCLLVCTLVLGAMLSATPTSAQLASAGSALLASPAQCALPADGVICPRQPG